jgi:hypothetical protein
MEILFGNVRIPCDAATHHIERTRSPSEQEEKSDIIGWWWQGDIKAWWLVVVAALCLDMRYIV